MILSVASISGSFAIPLAGGRTGYLIVVNAALLTHWKPCCDLRDPTKRVRELIKFPSVIRRFCIGKKKPGAVAEQEKEHFEGLSFVKVCLGCC